MSVDYDLDCGELISGLAGSLSPLDRLFVERFAVSYPALGKCSMPTARRSAAAPDAAP